MSRIFATIPFLLFFVVHQIGQVFPESGLAPLTKPFIVPSIALAFLFATGQLRQQGRHPSSTIIWLTIGALFFSWLGDIALMFSGEIWFIGGVLMFLIAQLFYIPLFVKFIRKHRGFRPWSLLYGLAYVGLMVVLVPHTGNLLIPVAVYGAVLALMALFASRANGAVLLGGLLFLISDSILALNKFVPKDTLTIPQSGFWVMFTYSLAQACIAFGIYRHIRDSGKNISQENHLV